MEIQIPPKKKMLFVEDDPGWRLIISYMVKKMDIEALYAESGEDALEIIQDRNDVSVMFLDVSLGNGITGMDLAGRIKSKQCYKDIPLIAMTAYEKRSIAGYEENGFTGYLQKPYSADQFGAVLERQHLLD
ncbi:MAG: response regulator [Candidatus Marinimicrobia bacterium]|jgi:CheY-like chemotaxis protein|nr:response regulator [Candidatus Neomarinimicrobiota bacterium]MBT3631494.1 response regulator [Candidatus Neomarinimicrobiota bacterium]MBT3823830.1 response regulator [Candidatus Neomarinimicrobiota bacterium]MBT4129845.1 response regulator [Candidatus Neomarinimicrobiota bacterium]MBT4294546.1 response regulator [Candidatus Neomarinimicrobiota bacterium]